MIGALWTGISGLSSQQKALDNESHNIANVNTVGYKSSRISFADQMYQDRIGKGSKILDAEKLYVQGNLKVTGVNYDMALSGNGFFAVANKSATGTSETFYTRAGNFRMGDNGTLQDAAGNEVQGWAMTPLTADDITSTNPNISVFTGAYNQLLSSKIVNHSNYVETFTAKATDYTQTVKSDSSTVFSGYGLKTAASKTQDIEALITNYNTALSSYQANPDGSSQSAISQTTQVNFAGSDFKKEGDQIYVYLDGNKISQNFISSPARGSFTALEASQIDTYKALADKISKITGFVAYNVTDQQLAGSTQSTGGTVDLFESSDTFLKSTADADVLKGMIEIKSLVPGKEFKITEVAEVSGSKTTYGAFNDTLSAQPSVAGLGLGGLQSAREALSQAISGNQRDVYSTKELNLNGADDYNISLTIYDKDTQQNVTINPPLVITNPSSMDDVVNQINDVGATYQNTATREFFDKYFTAKNVNGSLVIETNNLNYDVEFSTELTASSINYANTYSVPSPSSYTATVSSPTSTFTGLTFDGKTDYTFTDQVPNSYTVTGASSLSDMVTKLNLQLGADYTASASGSNLVITNGNNTATSFTATPKTDTSVTFTGSTAILANGQSSFTFTAITPSVAAITVTAPQDLAALATSLNDQFEKNSPKTNLLADVINGELVVSAVADRPNGDLTITQNGALDVNVQKVQGGLEKNAEYSGRKGAGAEFLEIKNTLDQTASLSSLQLRLDTLSISDSAFGEFSVDSTGLITMKQDGAEFAVGQVAIALFNNERGLNPSGDNLLAKTTQSGEPTYNINNDRTAKIEAQTLELSTADLSESLVNLMVFQRAFEANAKSITTSDTLLNTLINLKR